MYLQVNASGVALVEVDDFAAFAVVVLGEHDLNAALDGFGVVNGEHVFVDVESVQALAGERATVDWLERFDKMIEFARSKGWVDEAGRVRAHIERR